MPSNRSRRQIIHAGIGVLTGYAGCSLRKQSNITLSGVRVENFTSRSERVSVTVEKDGTLVHESTVVVEATTMTDDEENVFGAKFIDCTWDADVSGDFMVTARQKRTDETVRIGDDAHLDGGCHWISVRVDSSFYALWNDSEPYDDGDNLCR